jgi:hypothetical protein
MSWDIIDSLVKWKHVNGTSKMELPITQYVHDPSQGSDGLKRQARHQIWKFSGVVDWDLGISSVILLLSRLQYATGEEVTSLETGLGINTAFSRL